MTNETQNHYDFDATKERKIPFLSTTGGLDRNEIRVATHTDDAGNVVVEVADNGVGIPEEKLARLFEPFFTTKPAGVGTGLGLAICQRIVGELGGSIAVESAIGVGTRFAVTLRRAGATAPVVLAPPVVARPTRRGRILVIDDEPALCKTIERILAPEHDVVALVSARAALDLLATDQRFDAILSDVMMPEMSGMALHSQIAETWPELAARMAFMTGGAFSVEAGEFIASRRERTIDKPFRPNTLRKLLQDVISIASSDT